MTYSLNRFFGCLGHFIGTHPVFFLLLSLFFFSVSLLGPIFRLNIKTSIKSGFTRGDAASLNEITAYRNFFNSTGEPWYMALFAICKNETSMLDDIQSDELTSFYKFITQEMPIGDPIHGIHYHYDLCYPFCNFNSQLWNLINYHTYFKIRYPLSTVGPYKVNIGKYVFKRTTNSRGIVTRFGVVAMYFTTFINDEITKRHLEKFETQVLREVEAHNAVDNNTLKLVLHGAYTVNKEVRRGVWFAMPYYLIGVILLTIFVFAGFILTAVCYKQFSKSRILIALLSIISPTLAAISSIGYILIFGYHINVLILISPFLTLAIGIGVDDAFLLTNTWSRQCSTAYQRHLSPAESFRLRFVFEKVGVSMTITSITNVLGFALGCIAPAPEIQLFCAAVAIAMLLDLLYQLFFYAPLMVILAEDETYENYTLLMKKNELSIIGRMKKRLSDFTKSYSKFVTTLWAEFLVIAVLITYFLTTVSGIAKLQSNVDAKALLPSNSQSVEGIKIMNEILMIKSVESMRNSLGPPATTLWLKDYLRYLANPGASKLDVLFGITGNEANNTVYLQNGLDMSHFNSFIETEPYTGWKHGVRYKQDNENRTIITSMLLMMGYNSTTSIAGKAVLLERCRDICAQYPEYNMVPFDTDAELVDVILAVPHTTFSAVLFTVAAMGLVFLVFSMNLITTLLATASVASICTGVLGYLQYWGCDLDPVLMVAVIMTAGLSVDFTVHIILHYLVNGERYDNKAERMDATLRTCGLSLLQAGISTLLVMFPVLFSPIGVYAVIAKSIILVVIIGFLHGLFIIPVILTMLPSCLMRNCCFKCIQKCDSL